MGQNPVFASSQFLFWYEIQCLNSESIGQWRGQQVSIISYPKDKIHLALNFLKRLCILIANGY